MGRGGEEEKACRTTKERKEKTLPRTQVCFIVVKEGGTLGNI